MLEDFFSHVQDDLKGKSVPFEFKSDPNRASEETLIISVDNVTQTLECLKNSHGFKFLMDVCGVHYPKRDLNFDVVYHLFNDTENHRLRVKCPNNGTVPSVVSLWNGADWFEREAYDLYGIQFTGHPDLRRILCHDEFKGHPLRKDYPADLGQPMSGLPAEHYFEKDRERIMASHDDDLMWINIGPAHPATHGTLRFMAVIDGAEVIHELEVEIGYLHRCFEKMCETHNYNQIIPYTDRLNYCSAPMNNNCFAQAVEKLLNVQVPPRATMIRMILDELSRIMDHFVCIGTNILDLGGMTSFFYFFHEREQIYTLFEKLCGARLTVSLTRIGGMGFDLPSGWVEETRDVLKSIEKTHAEVHHLVTNNRIFIQRTRGAGAISQNAAISHGFTGPCLRATGYPLDLRKLEPYYFYDQVNFDVPVGTNGDTYDRYLVRMEEVLQSIKIIRWALDNLPEGPLCVPDKGIALPPKSEVYGNIEGLMNHFMLVINGVKTPVGEVYHKSEAANGELGFYIVSDGSGVPYRVKCRPPCFALLGGFKEMTKGGRLADAIAALGSLNVIAGELDR